MTQFIIEVIVDPGKGVKGARRMGDALRQVEGAAAKMRNELKRVEGRAGRTGNVLRRVGSAAGEMRNAFAQAEGSAGKLDRELKDVGTAASKTGNDFKRAGTSANKMQDQLKRVGGGADKAGNSLKRVGTAAGKMRGQMQKTTTSAMKLRQALARFATIAVIVAGFTAAIRTLASFSQEMSTVAAITRATGDEFDALQEKAKTLGTTTRFTATQAAEGMTFLARAGFETNEVLTAIEGTLNLAQAGALELGAAADIASNVLTAFRLNVAQTGRVVDVLALAANSANTTVQQLGDGMKLVAPIAAGVGVELEEVTAAMSSLSNAGLQATLAGTGLRRVISELESSTPKTAATLEGLGLTTEDYKVSSVGLTAALEALTNAGVDTGLALEIFGDRGGPAFEVLSSSIPEVKSMTAALKNADGTAARIAATMDDNLNGSLLRLKSALEGVVLEAGEQGATGALRTFFEVTTDGLRVIEDNVVAVIAAFGFLTAGIILLTTALGASAIASAAAAGAYIVQAIAAVQLAVAVGGVTFAATSAAIAFKAFLFTNPFALLIAGAAALFVVVNKLTKGIEEYKKTLKIADAGVSSGKTPFGRLGDDIIRVQGNLTRVTGIINNELTTKGIASPVALRKAAEYREELEKLKATSRLFTSGLAEQGDTIDEVRIKQSNLTRAFESSIEAIEAGNVLLGKSSRERDIQIALLAEVAALENKFGEGTVSDTQKETLEALLRTNQGYRDQADAFDRIRGPQDNFRAQVEALDALLDAGRITQSEFNDELAEMASNLDATDFAALELDSFLEGIDGVDTEGLRKLLADLRAASAGGGFVGPPAPEKDVVPKGAKPDTGPLSSLLQRQAELLNQLRGPQEALIETQTALKQLFDDSKISAEEYGILLNEATVKANPALQRQAELYNEIKGPQEALIETQAALNQLLAEGTINADEYAIALNNATIAANDLSTDAGQGVAAGLAQIKNEIMDVSGTVQGALVNSFNEGKNALVDFIKTGELDFSSFVDSILSGIAEIILQQALLAALDKSIADTGTATATASAAAATATAATAAAAATASTAAAGAATAAATTAVTAASGATAAAAAATAAAAAAAVAAAAAGGAAAGGAAGGGGVASLVSGLFGGGAAHGGPTHPGEIRRVGEQGPELFAPDTAGQIIPAGETAALLAPQQQAAPVVNVSPPEVNIINVSDPSEIPTGIESPEGEAAVMNVLRRNRGQTKALIA